MTNLKLALACGMLLAAISVTNRETSVTPAQPFWELQGAAPGARETAAMAAWRSDAGEGQEPSIQVAAR